MKPGDDAVERRFAKVEEQLSLLLARMDKVEQNLSRAPVVADRVNPVAPDEEIVIDAEKAEYLIGAQLLPRLGAVVIVLAVILYAALGAAKGGNGDGLPVVVGELLACLAFFAVGEWKRNELEGFGLVLSAIGSCGLYLSAASAHFAYGLIGRESLAFVFLSISLLVLAYSSLRRAKAFYVMGALGGLVASFLPLTDHNYLLACGALSAIALVGSYVAIKRAWPVMVLIHWLLGLIALIPLVASEQSWALLVPAFYVSSLALIVAYVKGLPLDDGRFRAWPAPIALFLTGLIGWGMQHGPLGSVHLLALVGAAAIAGTTLPRESGGRDLVLVGAAATGGILIPWCFPWITATALFVAFATLGWLVSRFAMPRLAAAFSVMELALATWSYSYAAQGGLTFTADNLILGALSLGILFAALATTRAKWNGTAVAALGIWLLIAKWSQVLYAHFGTASGTLSASTLAWIVYAVLLLVLGFAFRSPTLRFCSFGVLFVTIGKILVLDLSSTAVTFRVGVLLALGLLMLVGGYVYVRGSTARAARLH